MLNHNSLFKEKVKCSKVHPCTGTEARVRTTHRGSIGLALLFLDHGTRRGWVVSSTHRPLFTPGKDPLPIVQEAGWAPEPVWTGAENLAPTGIRSPDRPARSQSLYRLSYRARTILSTALKFQQERKENLLTCIRYKIPQNSTAICSVLRMRCLHYVECALKGMWNFWAIRQTKIPLHLNVIQILTNPLCLLIVFTV